MIRSHSVSGDLHGVQPDPIAADILRKEPEQETFARLKISPMGIDCFSSILLLIILALACEIGKIFKGFLLSYFMNF